MHIHRLPDDILKAIIEYSLFQYDDPALAFKCNTVLLSLSSKLRSVAVPLVYKVMYIVPSKVVAPTGYSGTPKSVNVITSPDMDTNLELIYEGGLADVVQHVKVEVHFTTNPFSNFRVLFSCLSRVCRRWHSVESLRLILRPDIYYTEGMSINLAQFERDIQTLSSGLYKLMPKISKLELWEATHNILIKELFGRIVSVYASQLTELVSQTQLSVPHTCHLKKLKHVNLDFHNEFNEQCPHIVPETLVSLKLTNGSPSQLWMPFILKPSRTSIVFPSLLKLEVSHGSWNGDGQGYENFLLSHKDKLAKLHFPRLKYLYINDRYCSSTFLSFIALPAQMDNITIHTSAAGIRDVAERKLPTATSLTMALDSFVCSLHILSLANHILSNSQASKELKLLVFSDGLRALPENITCIGLTRLLIAAPTSMDTMAAFIHKLPKLLELEIHSLTQGNMCHDISVPGPDERTRIEPFVTGIKSLELHFNSQEFPTRARVPAFKYLLLKIPSLEQMVAPRVPREPIADFVVDYMPRYPHLEHIKFLLYAPKEK